MLAEELEAIELNKSLSQVSGAADFHQRANYAFSAYTYKGLCLA